MKPVNRVVMDEKKFEKWLKELGIKFTRHKGHYKLSKPVRVVDAIMHGVVVAETQDDGMDANKIVDLQTKMKHFPEFMLLVKGVPATAVCTDYTSYCLELSSRLTMGSLKYAASWKFVDLLKELEQELYDIAGYAYLEWLKRQLAKKKLTRLTERKLCAIAGAAVVLWQFVKEMQACEKREKKLKEK